MFLEEDYRQAVRQLIRDGQANVVLKEIEEQYSEFFSKGEKGWELYKEFGALIREASPEQFEVFKKRFSHLLDTDAISVELLKTITPQDVTKAFQAEAKALREQRDSEPGFFARLFGRK